MAILCCLIKTAALAEGYTVLKAIEEEIDVNGKKAKVYNLVQSDGTTGLNRTQGSDFAVLLENHTTKPTCVHWHGLILPNDQDGVPYVTQAPIPPGGSYAYNFKIVQHGSYWMHSHYRFQEQQLLSAPLIIYKNEKEHRQANDCIMFIEDFTFENPEKIFENLRTSAKEMAISRDLNDVKFDVFLTNRKTLKNPSVCTVSPGQKVRLRVINGSSATNFYIDTGYLNGTAVAVDGQDIEPIEDRVFLLATAQRIDILVTIPEEGGSFPILAVGEGTPMQTGLILATPKANIPIIGEFISQPTGAFTYQQEKKFRTLKPLAAKPVSRTITASLEGDMRQYIWMINNQAWPYITPLMIKEGERVEIVFDNKTEMEHPMHFHGHIFQVTEINGEPVKGAKRDTILVLPKTKVKVQFDANNPGIWVLHCHNLYHLHAGMMTSVNYEGYPVPTYTKKEQLSAN